MFKLSRSVLAALAVTLGLGGVSLQALADKIDLSNTPVAGTGQAPPKPNVMLLMDTSKSMAFTHMPDEVEDPSKYVLSVGYRSAQCNSLYYDPNKKYTLPKDAGQSDLPAPLFNAARYNYYSPALAPDLSTVDLSSKFRAYDRNTRQTAIANSAEDPEQAANYYVYSGTGTLVPNTTIASPCADLQSNLFPAGTDFTTDTLSASTAGAGWNGRWTRKKVNSVSGTGPAGADERLNFAIWYQYYRTRMAMVKSSISSAFAPLSDKFRIGFVSMNPLNDSSNADSGVAPAKYLAIRDFTAANKAAWYSKIYDQVPFASSPAREGLARVGRHYGGRADGINKDMGPDPVQYSCQQNFTIMTTDGYWNTVAETRGPVGLDGLTPVGNTDGILTAADKLNRDDQGSYSHRPMWDGAYSGKRTDTNRMQQQRYLGCDSGQFYKTTTVMHQTTTQPVKTTQQLTKSTAQISMSTEQLAKSTSQTQQTTTTETKQTLQALASTQQTTLSTRQERRQVSWYGSGSTSTYKSTTQVLQTTSYKQKEVTTRRSQTFQTLEVSSRMLKQTTQTKRSTVINRQSTSQQLMTRTTYSMTTTQPTRSTSQLQLKTTRVAERTSQLTAYDARTEQSVPVASCTNTGTITCITLTTGPTFVASCSPQSASSGNNYLARTCDAPVVTGPSPAASCTAADPASGNNFTKTECSTVTTGPTVVPSCTASPATSSNNYTTTTCGSNNTGPTPTATCTAGTNSSTNVTTACAPTTVSAEAPVQNCTPGTAGTVSTTCRTATTTNVPVSSCTPSGPTSPDWITTTCPAPLTTGPTAVSSCSPITATSGNGWKTTSCSTVPSGFAGTDSCTIADPASNNSWTKTECKADSSAAASAPVQSCNAQTPTSGNGYLQKVCTPNNSAITDSASCVDIAPTSGNGWQTTTCTNPVTTPKTAVFANACTPGWSGATFTTCSDFLETDKPVASCTGNTTGPTYVSCRTVTTGPVVAACTAGGGADTNWVITTCSPGPAVAEGPVSSCTPGSTNTGGVTTTCTLHSEVQNIQPGSCAAQSPNSSNGYTTITCLAPVVTSEPRPLNSCTSAPASAPAWVATTCSTPAATAFAPVQSCVSGDNPTTFVRTTCSNNNSVVEQVVPGSCTPAEANSGNQWTQTVCTRSPSTVGVAANSCSPVTPTSANGFTQVTCANVNTGPTFVPLGSCSAGTDNNQMKTDCATTKTGPTLVASCAAGTDANFKVTTCNTARTGPTQIAYVSPTPPNEAASASNNYVSTTYAAVNTTIGVADGSCTPSASGVLPVITCTSRTTPDTAVAACTGGTSGTFVTSVCTPATTGPDRVSSCTTTTPTAGNGYTATTCGGIPGLKIQTNTQDSTVTYTVSGSAVIPGTATATQITETGWQDAAGGMCYVDPQRPPAIDATAGFKQATSGMPSGCAAWPCLGTVDTSSAYAGSKNSLADVAQYYYTTDLRTSAAGVTPDPWKNDVPKLGSGIEDDRAPWQHMTTFVLGLGVSGTLNYKDNYKSASDGDFSRIRSYKPEDMGVNWPVWPTKDPMDDALGYNDPRSIDDFWHTAVNGRGKFFSAKDPDSVVQGLQEALAGIAAQAGAGAGAATSSLTPTSGDNAAYTASFTTAEWTGDVQSRDIDLSTGAISTTVNWSARSLLDNTTQADCDNRKIYAKDPTNNALIDFSWSTKSCASGTVSTGLPSQLQSYFTADTLFASADLTVGWAQYPTMSVDQKTAARGANLVNFLRGQRGKEGFIANDPNKLYRLRSHILGDIVSSQPMYVKQPSLSYQDPGYADFKTANATRTPMVYVGGNDGMLHAFYAPRKTDSNVALAGQEAWAYVPTPVFSNLYKLADTNYSQKHIFFVDGAPSSGDVYDPATTSWKTMLVGGLNAGGRGYYALDVTNPTAPKSMWEFNFADGCASNPVGATTDCNVGLTFGRPVITKLKDKRWVVMVTSGYNNITGSGADGKGYLYVIDAISGKLIMRLGTGAGSVGDPSGLRELNYFVSNVAYDNTALRAYGADIKGNVWRFDINDLIAPPGNEAMLIGTTKDKDGKAQPITTRPELAEVSGSTLVMVGTGKLVSLNDLTDTSVQTVYAMKDPLNATAPGYNDLRASLKSLTLTKSAATGKRTVACTGTTATDCSSTNGWYIDLPDGGERVNIDMQTVLGTLVFATNVPSNTICVAGGYSWLNFVNLINGEAVSSSEGGATSVPFFANTVAVGLGLIGIGGGDTSGTGGSKSGIIAVGTGADGSNTSIDVPVANPPPVGKRISWREITQ